MLIEIKTLDEPRKRGIYCITNLENNKIYISAEKRYGLDLLLDSLVQLLDDGKERHALLIPYDCLSRVSALHCDATVEEEIYSEEGVRITATLDKKSVGKYAEYIVQ